jgi:hypothetical protein
MADILARTVRQKSSRAKSSVSYAQLIFVAQLRFVLPSNLAKVAGRSLPDSHGETACAAKKNAVEPTTIGR